MPEKRPTHKNTGTMDAPPTAAADAPAGNEATVEDNDLDIDEADLAEELEKAMQEDEQPGLLPLHTAIDLHNE